MTLVLHFQINEKTLQQWLDHEVEVLVHTHEVQSEYEKQSKMCVPEGLLYVSVPILSACYFS